MPLKLVRRKGSPYWYIRGTVQGREVFESTGATERIAADLLRLGRENDLVRQAREGDRKTFTAAALLYLKNGGERTYIPAIDAALGHLALEDITQEVIDTAARATYPTQSNASVRRWFYDPCMAVLNCAVRAGWCHPKLIRKPKVKTPPPDFCELDYLEKLWAACLRPHLRALLIFLPYTGCRLGECLALTWGRVNLEGEYAFILKTKSGAPRMVDLPPIVVEALRAIRPESPQIEDSVFGYQTVQGVSHCVRRACARAGIPYKRPHVIGSHTYATWMRQHFGLDGRGLTMTGRWKDPRSTEKYAHAHISEVAKKSRLLPVPVQKSVQSDASD